MSENHSTVPRGERGARDADAPAKGAALLRAVEVMDALCAPDGDAWARRQTHSSLARYLLEETHEVLETIDRPGAAESGELTDELGDLLFQVLFHARVGENGRHRFDIDDVARAFITKMERRNPHVFGPDRHEALEDREDVEQIVAQWHRVKAEEKAARAAVPGRGDDGSEGETGPEWFRSIPAGLPALQTAAKAVHRARSEGRLEELTAAADAAASAPDAEEWGGAGARALLDLVIAAEQDDTDPESALRALLHRTRDELA